MHFQALGIYVVGAYLIMNSTLIDKINIFSNVVVFSSYGMQVIISFLLLTFIFMVLPRALVSIKRINEVLDSDISILSGKFKGSTKHTQWCEITLYRHRNFLITPETF